MPVTVVLAIGFDPWLLEAQRYTWQSFEHFLTPAGSVYEAIGHFRDGDFDAVLLGESVPAKSREQIISLIRSSGSNVPVLCVGEGSSSCDACEFSAIKKAPAELILRIKELLAAPITKPAAGKLVGIEGSAAARSGRRLPADINRSGMKRHARRSGMEDLEIDLVSKTGDPSGPCFTICFSAGDAKGADEKGRGPGVSERKAG